MRRLALIAAAAGLVSACRPIRTAHTYDFAYPRHRSDFTLRWIGSPSGHAALWISTANDGEDNGRYDGLQVIVDPGTPADVESTVLPYLLAHGLKRGQPIAYVLSTNAEAPMLAGVERIAREFRVKRVVEPVRPGTHGSRELGGSLPGYLELGPEITARTLSPEGPGGAGSQAYLIRFIDTHVLLLPDVPESAAPEYFSRLHGLFRKEGLHVTVLSANPSDATAARRVFAPEVLVGSADAGESIALADPKAGETVEVTSNGSEVHAPGPRTRSRYGHWIDCHGASDCRATLEATPSGALLVKATIAGADGWFLVDTRSPLSFLARARYETLPEWEKAPTTPDEHGIEPVGAEVPAFALGENGPSVAHWHVLPCPGFTVGGHEVAGVLGMDLLQSFRITLAKTGKTRSVTLAPNFDDERESLEPAKTLDDGRYDLPMDRSPAGPLILSTLDGESKSLVVDLSAAESTIFVRTEDLAKKVGAPTERRWASFETPGDYTDAKWSENAVHAGPLKVADLNLFGAHFPNRVLLAVDHPLSSDVLGMDFLDTFSKSELDFRRRSLLLTR